MRFGHFVGDPMPWFALNLSNGGTVSGSSLHAQALQWLKDDREFRLELENKGRKGRGARPEGVSRT